MSRAHFFLVVSADTDAIDVEEGGLRAGLAMVVSDAVARRCRWAKGPVDVRVIDARLAGEVDHA